MIARLRVCIRVTLCASWILCIMIPLFITWQLRCKRANSLMMQFSFIVGCLIWGVRVKMQGTLATSRPLLVVSNHFSYLDVFALGSKIPARFITKSEVASWPVIGFVCRIGSCLFIDRRPSRTLYNMSELTQAVKEGSVISLFPEGTTNEGLGMRPFKSSFFVVAEDGGLPVQPVSVVYTALSGKPMDDAARPVVGWYGDATFFPHMLRFMQESSVNVTLVFHTPVDGAAFTSRKELAQYCRDQIESTLA